MADRRGALETTGSPERMGRYALLTPIARGGMATVYLARMRGPRGFQRDVALKLMHPHLRDSPQFITDLIHEAMLSIRIRHPNVVSVLEADEDASGVYLVMEYVEGESLAGLRRAAEHAGSTLPTAVGLRILVDALAGLDAAHDVTDDGGRPLGLVHRDFSPQNLLVGTDGSTRLADFGVAKATARLGNTQTGLIKGKIGYMAPEQARAGAIDRRCDIWAAGVVAWEIVTGRRLYPSNDASTLLEIVNNVPPRTHSVRPDVPHDLDDAIAQALSLEARHRFPTAGSFSEAIVRSGVEIADAREVAEHVVRFVGPALTERRDRVRAIVETSESSVSGTTRLVQEARTDPTETRTETNSVASAEQTRPRQPRTRGLRAVGAAASVALLAAVGVLASRRHETAGPSVAPSAVGEEARSADTKALPPPEPTPVPEPTSAATPASRALNVTANAPIASLSVDGRAVPIARPTAALDVQLRPDEATRDVEIVATDARGRTAKHSVARNDASAELKFGGATRSATQKPSERPLAASPYGTP